MPPYIDTFINDKWFHFTRGLDERSSSLFHGDETNSKSFLELEKDIKFGAYDFVGLVKDAILYGSKDAEIWVENLPFKKRNSSLSLMIKQKKPTCKFVSSL